MAEALGRLFNVVPTAADSAVVSMRDASAVTFVCIGANAETFTIAEATDAAASGAQTLACVTHYYKNTGAVGATAWVREPALTEQAATGVVTTTTAHPVAVIHVAATSLSAGYDYLRVTSSSTGTVVAILHDLATQRTPQNLPAVAV